MFRAVLAIYLMLVAALGPGLCCCTLSQLVHQECQTSTNNAGSHQKKSCCKHGHQDEQRGNSNNPSSTPSCPCKNHQNIPVAAVSQNLMIASLVLEFASDQQILLDFQSVLLTSTSLSVQSMSCIGCLHESQFSAQDILRAPFVLLC